MSGAMDRRSVLGAGPAGADGLLYVSTGVGKGGFHDSFVTWSLKSTCSPSGLAVAKGKAWVGAPQGEFLFSVSSTSRTGGAHAGTWPARSAGCAPSNAHPTGRCGSPRAAARTPA